MAPVAWWFYRSRCCALHRRRSAETHRFGQPHGSATAARAGSRKKRSHRGQSARSWTRT